MFPHLDFDLLLERATLGYRAHVIGSPAGQATNEFTLPFAEAELASLLNRISQAYLGSSNTLSDCSEAAKILGGRLFDAIFEGAVRACLSNSLDEAERQGAGLRVRLRLNDVARAGQPALGIPLQSRPRTLPDPFVKHSHCPIPGVAGTCQTVGS